jgi:hypothetical protein
MPVKRFALHLGRLTVCLELRCAGAAPPPLRRYRPAPRRWVARAHERLLHRLAGAFPPGSTS